MAEIEQTARYLSQNIISLRKKKSFTQSELAKLSGIPRSTLTNIESGVANPSLSNLVKVSAALGVSVEELLSRPRAECLLIPSHEVKIQTRNRGKVSIYKLMPDKIKGIEIDKVDFSENSIMPGQPHLAGTKEYLTVIKGEITVNLSGESYHVKEGDVLAFPGNQAHSYKNSKNKPAQIISIVIPVPLFI